MEILEERKKEKDFANSIGNATTNIKFVAVTVLQNRSNFKTKMVY
jgi:hypothetical protein